MIDFNDQYHILAMALRLGKAANFKAVGKEGKENYQFLFSKLIKMVENDQDSFFIETDKKNDLIHSLGHTIDYYDAKKKEDIQHIIENLREDDPTSFVIIPSYSTTTRLFHDHIYSLIIHKKEDYIVTKIDKLESMISNFQLKVDPKNLDKLSDILYYSKFDYRKTRISVDIFSKLKKISTEKPFALHNKLRGYPGITNCPILEPLTALKWTVYNCNKPILSDEIKKKQVIYPKLWPSKDLRVRFYQTFLGDDEQHNRQFSMLWNYYVMRKIETQLVDKEYIGKIRCLSIKYLSKVLNDPAIPIEFKKNQTNEASKSKYKVFHSRSKKLETLHTKISNIINKKCMPIDESQNKNAVNSQHFTLSTRIVPTSSDNVSYIGSPSKKESQACSIQR
ncbi:hypothetical protein [Enterococcus mundtii]|uniref:Uncharacterized protein n=1 Tax=Enterococcus mundtii TaxID=53346 RepID=A0A2S7RQU3_ENTMU|nr:hypothetical protein [Enterococcus mundtii]PQF21947.1 hypothetical protein CUS89_12270 [Enterococcus mundtii]